MESLNIGSLTTVGWEHMPKAAVTVDLCTEDWIAMADNVGPFAPLPVLTEILEQAPRDAKNTLEYAWLKGLIEGRQIHEEFGGVDVET